jgi:uncharacterized membrane protein YeiH
MDAAVIYILDLFGTAVFAISGAMVAGRKRMDIFGGIVLSVVTAVGGGTLRDILLEGVGVFWIERELYLAVAIITSIITFYILRGIRIPTRIFLIFDALGLSVFSVVGAMKGYAVTESAFIALFMGVMTGVAGGMIRDVLADDIPLILRREIYATASLCGAGIYLMLHRSGIPLLAALGISSAAVLFIRITAIEKQLSLPVFFLKQSEETTNT